MHKRFEGIKQIIVKCVLIIDSITFKDTEDHTTKFGGNDGDKTIKISIDFPSEFLTGISGTHDSAWFFPNNVTSLTFITNKTQHGPLGTIWGTEFSANANDAVVTGFHGRCGKYVEAIGLYIKPVSALSRKPDDAVFSAVKGVHLRFSIDSAFRFYGKKIPLKARIKARIDEGFWKFKSKDLNF